MSKKRFRRPPQLRTRHKLAAVATAAYFVGHHSLEAVVFKLFELISNHAGATVAVAAFIGLGIAYKMGACKP
jgi:hypothetical protein